MKTYNFRTQEAYDLCRYLITIQHFTEGEKIFRHPSYGLISLKYKYISTYYSNSHPHGKDVFSKSILFGVKEMRNPEVIDVMALKLDDLLPNKSILCGMPSSTGRHCGLDEVISRLEKCGHQNGYALIRTYVKNKLDKSMTVEEIMDTLHCNYDLVRGQDIVLLDDIITTGKSMLAAKLLLEKSSVKSISCIALGGTARW